MANLSERDRRFALLVAMMAPDRRWQAARRRMSLLTRREYAMDPEEQPIVTGANKERVRAGVTGHNVRTVLIVSVALVIVLFVAIALYKP